jgi:hypothetical protein
MSMPLTRRQAKVFVLDRTITMLLNEMEGLGVYHNDPTLKEEADSFIEMLERKLDRLRRQPKSKSSRKNSESSND